MLHTHTHTHTQKKTKKLRNLSVNKKFSGFEPMIAALYVRRAIKVRRYRYCRYQII